MKLLKDLERLVDHYNALLESGKLTDSEAETLAEAIKATLNICCRMIDVEIEYKNRKAVRKANKE
jgi:ElaB/YqjD/DUF883 family membrane-anchored ribosome-binding protein